MVFGSSSSLVSEAVEIEEEVEVRAVASIALLVAVMVTLVVVAEVLVAVVLTMLLMVVMVLESLVPSRSVVGSVGGGGSSAVVVGLVMVVEVGVKTGDVPSGAICLIAASIAATVAVPVGVAAPSGETGSSRLFSSI